MRRRIPQLFETKPLSGIRLMAGKSLIMLLNEGLKSRFKARCYLLS
jgi:hypothetical protein